MVGVFEEVNDVVGIVTGGVGHVFGEDGDAIVAIGGEIDGDGGMTGGV